MGLVAKDLPSLISMLLPGFLAAGVFYTLTAHPRLSEFERLIQALIFTVILKVLTATIKGSMTALGKIIVLGSWTDEIELTWSVILAGALGLSFAFLANRDIFHRSLRRRKITTRTSYPSEWYSAFAREKRWVILHLLDSRRLSGWPEEWPDQPDRGHFVLAGPAWILADNERAPLYQVERFMIPAVDVKMVEFLKEDNEVTEASTEVDRVDRLLIDIQKERTDGSEGTAADPGPPDEFTGGD